VPQPSLDLIRGVPLFAAADDRFLERLAGEFMERTFNAGDTIAEEGASGQTFIVIERGQVSVTVHGQEVGRLGPGDAFGEMALIDKSARTATIRADTNVHVYQLPVWSFRPLVESHPEMAWALLETVAQRVREAEARAGSSGNRSERA
jgi:CRP/FNR family transcriptional regulator, cyclic AMP receptor protein